jgi:hypothetical protein
VLGSAAGLAQPLAAKAVIDALAANGSLPSGANLPSGSPRLIARSSH